MMSQQRTRKIGGAAIEPARGRPSVVKASGDAMSSNVQHQQPNVRSTSKSKLPKSLRYDLENALVSLCDVWFEEIKPHLVRNNIKLHVHGGAGPASGDYQRLPPGAPGCSHLDPGAAPDVYRRATASCADCYSTQPTASRARCRRPPASCRPACPSPVTSPSKLRASLLNPYQNCEPKIPRNSLARRTSRPQPHPHTQHLRNWRMPRLCQTFSILTPRTNPPELKRRTQTAVPQISRVTFQRNQYKRRPKKKDKSTQTPVLRKPEPLPACQEESWRQELVRQELFRQKQHKQNLRGQESYKQEPYKQDLRGQESYRQELCKQNLRGQESYRQELYKQDLRGQESYRQEPYKQDLRGQESYRQEPYKQDLRGQESYRQEPYKQDLRGQESYRQEPYKQDLLGQESYKHELFRQLNKKDHSSLKATTPSCLRCPATTTLCHTHRNRKASPPVVPLFQEDLINILVEKNDKQLRLLYKSPTRDNPSSLNLALACPPRLLSSSKRAPWR